MTDSQRAALVAMLDAEGLDEPLAVIVAWLRDADLITPEMVQKMIAYSVNDALRQEVRP